jgi:A/G-specific adenine glycosylase
MQKPQCAREATRGYIIATMPRSLATSVLKWYMAHDRPLPWRGISDPYRVWVSEIMAQQTQVETVIPFYQRWLQRFPTVGALAAASLTEVLVYWEGLGYYARARNLHRAAQLVVGQYGGELPRTLEGLRALPGIGAYTAAAIGSMAFGLDAAALDGNIERVLARVFDIRQDVKSTAGRRAMRTLAQSLVPAGQAGDYNQALMDLGATVCTPRAPQCPVCPLRTICQARRLGVQHERPLPRPRAPLPQRQAAAAVVRKNGRVLLIQRPPEKLLGSLWAFPQSPSHARRPAADLQRALRNEWGLKIEVGAELATQVQTFSHYRLTLRVFDCRWTGGSAAGADRKWVRPSALDRYPMGKADRQIARGLQAPERPAGANRPSPRLRQPDR